MATHIDVIILNPNVGAQFKVIDIGIGKCRVNPYLVEDG
jgi:hypothetical protein